MTKTMAINAPTAMAVGRSRAFAFAGLVGGRAVDPERAGRPPRVGSPGRPLRGTGRDRSSVGSVPIVMRPGSRRSGMESSRLVMSSGSRPRGSMGITCSISSVSSWGSTGWSSCHTGAFPANDDQTSRSSDGSEGADVVSVRGISPVGGSVQCGSGPVSDAPNDNPSVVSSSSSVVSANNGGPKSSASPSSGRRLRRASSVMEIPFCSLRPRGVLALCGRRPCRSSPRARG